MHSFCCVSSIALTNSNMHASSSEPQPPLDPQSRSQPIPPISRASSARDSGLYRSLVGSLNNSSNMIHNHSREVKINDIVGNGISGVLYKWVNYGKGWRPRWFVLQDGVFSYYKIRGPDKIIVDQDTEKGSRVIGEESMKRISRQHRNHPHHHHHTNGNSGSPSKSRKPVGEVHLKVSSIRESRSDDKRFSIFTGTKRLHLRAEGKEDRTAWMEALQAIKDKFSRMSNSELMAPLEDIVVSTEKLRQIHQSFVQRDRSYQDLIQSYL